MREARELKRVHESLEYVTVYPYVNYVAYAYAREKKMFRKTPVTDLSCMESQK